MSTTYLDPTNIDINIEAENKYLKITIAVLREKMEELQRHQSEIIQKTQANFQDEIVQLQSMVNTLRSQLEKSQINQEEQLQLSMTSGTPSGVSV